MCNFPSSKNEKKLLKIVKKVAKNFAEYKICSIFALAISNGALVQLVRIRACHARGQGFESPTHRQEDDLKRSSFFVRRGLGQSGAVWHTCLRDMR